MTNPKPHKEPTEREMAPGYSQGISNISDDGLILPFFLALPCLLLHSFPPIFQIVDKDIYGFISGGGVVFFLFHRLSCAPFKSIFAHNWFESFLLIPHISLQFLKWLLLTLMVLIYLGTGPKPTPGYWHRLA